MNNFTQNNNERGSVFVYILLAIALFAALSYAVSRNNGNSSNIFTDEQSKIAAQEIIEYGNTIANAVQKLKLRGCSNTEISLENNGNFINATSPSDKSCHVFDINGGNINPSLAHEYYDGSIEIDGIGDTNGDASSTDLLFITSPIAGSGNDLGYGLETATAICANINFLLHGTETTPTEGDITRTSFVGSYTYQATATEFPDKPSACIEEVAGTLSYYQVLIAR